MYKQLKRLSSRLKKFFQKSSFKELGEILKRVESKSIIDALKARLNREHLLVDLKDGFGTHEINAYLDLLKYRRKHLSDDLYTWEMNDKRMYANHIQFLGLREEYFRDVFNDHYAFEWQDKVVVDIGGFVGDSALYFLQKGANKVIVYEPLLSNIKALRHNLKRYKKKVEIYQKAIAEQEGVVILSSDAPMGSPGFGMESGQYSFQCTGISLTNLLRGHPAHVVKIDCEGGEKYLCDVENDLIRSFPYWIVETHSPEIYSQIIQKFKQCGFKKLRDLSLSPAVNLIHFKLISHVPV